LLGRWLCHLSQAPVLTLSNGGLTCEDLGHREASSQGCKGGKQSFSCSLPFTQSIQQGLPCVRLCADHMVETQEVKSYSFPTSPLLFSHPLFCINTPQTQLHLDSKFSDLLVLLSPLTCRSAFHSWATSKCPGRDNGRRTSQHLKVQNHLLLGWQLAHSLLCP
jgi:hypothetical protein